MGLFISITIGIVINNTNTVDNSIICNTVTITVIILVLVCLSDYYKVEH